IKIIEKHVRDKVAEKLKVNDCLQLYEIAKRTPKRKQNPPRLLYIHDNVGEIAFDRLLISDFRNRGWFVISALRGGAITSDATLEDGAYVRMEEYADLIICAGPDTLGISWEE